VDKFLEVISIVTAGNKGTAVKANNYGRIISKKYRHRWKLFIKKSQYTAGE
jgi:hypothetical protein